jgi:hypothetical protein
MISQLLIAAALMALCVVIHVLGVSYAIGRLREAVARAQGFWRGAGLFIGLAAWIILLHLVEIAAWAVCYVRGDAMPDLPAALYFSAVTYTTTGYGDLVLPADWRLVGAVEALTGILMCGLSTGFFFAVVTRMFRGERQPG